MTEIPKMLIGKSEYTLPAILKILEEAVFPPVPTEWAEDLTDSLRQALLVTHLMMSTTTNQPEGFLISLIIG